MRIAPAPIKIIKSRMKILGFRMRDVLNIARVGNSLYEFAVNDHDSATFTTHAKSAGWPILEGYDSTKPADKKPLPAEVQERVTAGIVIRLAKDIFRTPIPRLKHFWLEFAKEKSLEVQVAQAIANLEKTKKATEKEEEEENNNEMAVVEEEEEKEEEQLGNETISISNTNKSTDSPCTDVAAMDIVSQDLIEATQESAMATTPQQ